MRSPFRRGRHAAEAPKNGIRSILTTAAVFAVAIAMACTVTGGTYALWNNQVALTGATVSTGTIGLTIDGATDLAVPGLDVAQLTPGSTAITARPLTLRNTSSTALLVSISGTTVSAPTATQLTPAQLSESVLISFRAATGTTCAVTGDGLEIPPSMSPLRMAVGATASACLEVRLAATAAAAFEKQPVAFSVALVGDQLRPNQ